MTEQQLTPEELEDVEAHGLKEIAAGIATVGAISTGGAAVAAMSGPAIPPAPIVQQARDDAMTAVGHAQESVGTLSRDAATLAEHGVANARAAVDPIVANTMTLAGDAVRQANATITSTRDTVDRTAEAAVGNIDEAVASTASYATATANSARETAEATVASAERTAEATVAYAAATAISVVRTVEGMANHWNVDVSVFGAEAKAQGSLTHPSGTVSVSDGSGRVLATADVKDGMATLSFETPAAGGTVTLHYPGNDTWAPSTQVLHCPPHAAL